MEEWRALEWSVLATWMFVADQTKTGEVPEIINQAIYKLSAGTFLMQVHRSGHEMNENNLLVLGRPPAWYSASAILDDARRKLFYLRMLHFSTGQVFVLYRMWLGIPLDDPEFRNWTSHRAEAVDHAARALQSLRSAASHARASRHAFLIAHAFPRLSPDQTAWLTAALNLARFAFRDAIVALHEARRMSRAIRIEFTDASMMLRNRDYR